MHIPSSMLHGAVCPVTAAVGIAGTGLAVYFARRTSEQPSPMRFSAVTAMVFAFQMLNFSVQNGTSGHLMGSVLALSFLGVPYAVISMAVVLTVQAVFFADGGINTLGANVINMAFIGVGCAGFVLSMFKRMNLSRSLSLGIVAWISVITASTACSLELAWAGTASLNKVLPAMVSVHALIGIGEIAITAVILVLLHMYQKMAKANEMMLTLAAGVMAISAVMLSPFASSFPDGLEYVSNTLGFSAVTPKIPVQGFLALGMGLTGIAVVFLVSQMTVKGVKLECEKK